MEKLSPQVFVFGSSITNSDDRCLSNPRNLDLVLAQSPASQRD